MQGCHSAIRTRNPDLFIPRGQYTVARIKRDLFRRSSIGASVVNREGGREGIPDFKMEKSIVERRVKQMEVEGVVFHSNVHVGATCRRNGLRPSMMPCSGGRLGQPFDFFEKSPGRELDGMVFAMTFLPQQNRRVAGLPQRDDRDHGGRQARDRHRRRRHGQRLHWHLVPAGRQVGDAAGDHAAAPRQGEQGAVLAALAAEAARLVQPGRGRQDRVLDLHHGLRRPQRQGGKVAYARVDAALKPIAGSAGELPADLVLFAMGFSGPVESGLMAELGLHLVPRGRFKGLDANERDYRIKGKAKLFAAGDIRRGQSLVVWAIREGRQAAHAIDKVFDGQVVAAALTCDRVKPRSPLEGPPRCVSTDVPSLDPAQGAPQVHKWMLLEHKSQGAVMQTPLEITFQGVEKSDAVENKIIEGFKQARKALRPHCAWPRRHRVGAPLRSTGQGLSNQDRDRDFDRAPIVVTHEPEVSQPQQDLLAGLRDAFETAQRCLDNTAARLSAGAKT